VKNRTIGLAAGALAGALLGLLIAWIITEPGDSAERRAIRPGDAVNLALASVGLVRQIASLRQR
jgi:hypothetical protein